VKQLRNLRSLLGIGLIWGILWSLLALTIGTAIGLIDPADIDPGEEPIVLAPIVGLVGFIGGVVFAALVSTAERGEPIHDIPLIRVALWGVLVAAAVPLVNGKVLPEVLVTIPLGAISALLSVGIVRKWPPRSSAWRR
jgi:hypothetical protein